MSKVSEFIDLLRSQVNRGIYVWGANGEDLNAMPDPTAWIRKREARHPADMERNIQRDLALYKKRKAAGVDPILAFDCSGLMYWAGHQLVVFDRDLNAQSIYKKCDHVPTYAVSRGDFIFKGTSPDNITHVGMYIGDGGEIECQGRDVGVVEDAYHPSKWFAAGHLPALLPDEPPKPTEKQVKTKGRVRVRTGNGTKYPQIKPTVPKGALLPYIGQAEDAPQWYIVEWQGQEGYISSNPKYTELI